jgi:hypothetical protein
MAPAMLDTELSRVRGNCPSGYLLVYITTIGLKPLSSFDRYRGIVKSDEDRVRTFYYILVFGDNFTGLRRPFHSLAQILGFLI